MLTVSGPSNAAESMTFYNTLKAFAFGPAPDINKCVIIEQVYRNNIAELILLFPESGELHYFSFGVLNQPF